MSVPDKNKIQMESHTAETYLINLRFLLIVCVVAGNMLEPMIRQSDLAEGILLWIFSFHMPLFVMVTGYFARFNLYGSAGIKALRTIGMQYILFQTLYSALDALWFQVPGVQHSFFAPYLLLWFLAGHALWRLMMIVMRRWSLAVQLAVTLLLGVGVGLLPVDGVWLAISRTFIYLPFFVIGYHLPVSKMITALHQARRKIGYAASIGLLILFTVAALHIQHMESFNGWFYGNRTFSQLGVPLKTGLLLRSLMYMIQLIASIAFLAWVPVRQHYITQLGRRTLYVFLLHGLLIRALEAAGLFDHIHMSIISILFILGLAVLIAVALAQPSIQRWTHYWIEPSLPRPVRLAFRLLQRRYSILR